MCRTIAISYLKLADKPLEVRCELCEVFGGGGEFFDGSCLLLDGGGGVERLSALISATASALARELSRMVSRAPVSPFTTAMISSSSRTSVSFAVRVCVT